MLYGELEDFKSGLCTSSALKAAVAFLLEKANAGEDGRVDLTDGIFADVKHYNPLPAAQRSYESHVEYVDVQCVLEGEEVVYVRTVDGLKPKEEYPERDLTFYHEPPEGLEYPVYLRPGLFLVLFPKDAHKTECLLKTPNCRKVVMKVPAGLMAWR